MPRLKRMAALSRIGESVLMITGFGLFIVSQALLVVAPVGNIWVLYLVAILEGCALPLTSTMMAKLTVVTVDPKERARIMAWLSAIVLLAASPFGWVAGQLSSLNRRYPFVLVVVLFTIGGLITLAASRSAHRTEVLVGDALVPEPRRRRMRQVVVADKGAREWQGIPTIDRAANGRLWSAFFSGGPREPDPDNQILLTTSADDGATWTPPHVVVDPPGPTRAYDPCLWHDLSGRLWLFYNRADLGDREFAIWAWSPRKMGRRRHVVGTAAYRARCALRLPAQQANGAGQRLVAIAGHLGARSSDGVVRRGRAAAGRGDLPGPGRVGLGAVKAPAWALEDMVVERAGELLWMLIRTGSGVLWQSFSEDGGVTWSKATPTDIVNPGVRFSSAGWRRSGCS